MATKIPGPQVHEPPYPRLILEIHVVDSLLFATVDWCETCVAEGSSVECNAWITLEGGEQDIVECCAACLIKKLDGTPYLDDTQTITVEVAHSATLRPF